MKNIIVRMPIKVDHILHSVMEDTLKEFVFEVEQSISLLSGPDTRNALFVTPKAFGRIKPFLQEYPFEGNTPSLFKLDRFIINTPVFDADNKRDLQGVSDGCIEFFIWNHV
jgi:hypothetical protein